MRDRDRRARERVGGDGGSRRRRRKSEGWREMSKGEGGDGGCRRRRVWDRERRARKREQMGAASGYWVVFCFLFFFFKVIR